MVSQVSDTETCRSPSKGRSQKLEGNMQQLRLSQFGFKAIPTGENTTLPATEVPPPQLAGSQTHGSTVRGGVNKRHNEARKMWSGINICTYNAETFGTDRARTIGREMEKKNMAVMLVQGTKCKYDGDARVGEYTIFYGGCGDKGTEASAGTAIIIRTQLMHGMTINKFTLINHRAIAVRLKSCNLDLTFITCYGISENQGVEKNQILERAQHRDKKTTQ